MSIKPEYFGKYILLDKLATGGMAEVYLAKSLGAENVSKLLAIKRILPQFSKNSEFVDMFKEEAKIAMNISHANIVSIFEFGEESGQFFIVMEYVEGRNLRQVLNRFNKSEGYFEIEDIVHIIKETARGLDHAHRHVDPTTGSPLNITHRDISPQNVMLSYEGEIKIVDFGIAKAESKLETTRAGTLKGKFGYMSPEQAEGLEVDYRTDIFSLGIVFWELLARERLFLSNNEMNTLKKIRECRIPSLSKINPQIPEELERIANKALARDRNLRYQTSGEMHKDLNKFLNRHYPDFNIDDFSAKIKKLYEKERAEMREVLIEFAKIRLPDINESTQVIGEDTKTITESGNSVSASAPQNLISDNDLKGSPKDIDVAFNSESSSIINQSPGKSSRKRGMSADSVSQSSYTDTSYPYGEASAAQYKQSRDHSSNLILAIVFLIGLSLVAYFYAKRQYPDKTAQYEDQFKQVVYPLIGKEHEEEGSLDQVSDSEHELVVTSVPAGAEILINNVKMGVTTPGKVRVPAGSKFRLSLNKEGYEYYATEFQTTQQANEVTINLVKANVGYVNINVRPGKATVYVDGKRLNKSPPIYNYAIPANRPVKITAFDSISRGSAETTVNVKKDTREEVTLFLKKRRSPSGR